MKSKIIREIYAAALQGRAALLCPQTYADTYRICAATAHLNENFRRGCSDCLGKLCAKMVQRGLNDAGKPLPYHDRPLCAALTRIGAICANRVIPGKTKCHLHGGKSTGPKTSAGKTRIAEAQKRRWAMYRAVKIPPEI